MSATTTAPAFFVPQFGVREWVNDRVATAVFPVAPAIQWQDRSAVTMLQRRSDARKLTYGRYAKLQEALAVLADRDEDEEYFIDRETYEAASDMLGHLVTAEIAPPKLFAQSSDAIVFTWQQGECEKLLTVSDGRFSLTEFDAAGVDRNLGRGKIGSESMIGILILLRGNDWRLTAF